MATALFLGRFQPFHKGHYNAITAAEARYEVIVGIGSAATHHTHENPLMFEEREQILNSCVPGITVLGFEDRNDNDEWTDQVEAAVDFDVVISGNSLVRQLLGERGYTVEDPDYLKPDVYQGTEIRRRIIADEEWENLVPACSRQHLHDFGFVERLKSIVQG